MVAKPSQISIKPSVTVWGENVTDMYRQEPYLSEECLTYFTHFPEWNTECFSCLYQINLRDTEWKPSRGHEEMARHLGELGALTMEHHSVPNTQTARLTEACKLQFQRDPMPFSGLCRHLHTHAYTHTQTYKENSFYPYYLSSDKVVFSKNTFLEINYMIFDWSLFLRYQ